MIIDINKGEISRAARVLQEAFSDDPFLRWVFIDEESYVENAYNLFHCCVKYAVLYGYAWRTENFEGVALRKKPGDTKDSIWRLLRSGLIFMPHYLGATSFKRLTLFETTVGSRKAEQGGEFLYCWMIGTAKKYRGKGFGGELMAHTFNVAKQQNVPCLLEVASESSKGIHLKKGYAEMASCQLDNAPFCISILSRK